MSRIPRPTVNPYLALPDDAEVPVDPELLAVGATGLGGSVLADPRGSRGVDRLRGLLKGLGTGAGAVAGARLAAPPGDYIGPNTVPYAAGGGLLGFLAAAGLSRIAGLENKPDDLDEIHPHHHKSAEEIGPGVLEHNESTPLADREPLGVSQGPSPVDVLRQAKAHSDRREYGRKHILLRKLLTERPGEFEITETTPDGFAYGLRHTSGFQIHIPVRMMPPYVQLRRAQGVA